MKLLLRARLSPMQVIVAATRTAAIACGRGDTVGTIEAGKAADLILVAGDPLADIETLRDPLLVIKGGKVVSREIPGSPEGSGYSTRTP